MWKNLTNYLYTMIFYIIPGSIIVICLIGVLVIVVRKFPQLVLINVESIKGAKETMVRNRIMADRIMRATKKVSTKFSFLDNLGRVITSFFSKLHKKLLDLEDKYELKLKRTEGKRESGTGGQVKILIESAYEAIKSEQWEKGEKYFIEAISIDGKSKEAYRGLANLYNAQKQYDQARETLEYILKLYPRDPDIYFELGEVYKSLDKIEKSVKYFKKAVDCSPKNPRNLDVLLETCIIVGDKKMAKTIFKKLSKVNPENQKLEDFNRRIKDIEEKR